MDSLMMLEIRNIVSKELDFKIPINSIDENTTIESLCDSILSLTSNEKIEEFLNVTDLGEFGKPPCVLGMGIGLAEYCYSQKEMEEMAVTYYKLSGKKEEKLRKIFQGSDINQRYSVLDIYNVNSKDLMRSFQTRNEVYEKEAIKLAVKSCNQAIQEWKGDKKKITHIVSVSTTGTKIPGIEFELVRSLGLSNSVQRVGVNFMGCFGSLPGIKTACAFAKLNPKNRVLLVSTEICSTHLEEETTSENFVSSAIFADGSGALIIGCPPFGDFEKPYWEIEKISSISIDNSLDKMYWKITDKGWRLGLSKDIPSLIYENVEFYVNSLLGKGYKIEDYDWALHPGGKAILMAIEKALKLKRDQTKISWEVMKNYGNMSSATILYVLNLLRENTKKELTCCLVFGPGLVMEGCLLKRM